MVPSKPVFKQRRFILNIYYTKYRKLAFVMIVQFKFSDNNQSLYNCFICQHIPSHGIEFNYPCLSNEENLFGIINQTLQYQMYQATWIILILIQILNITYQTQSITLPQTISFVPNIPSDYSITAQIQAEIAAEQKIRKKNQKKTDHHVDSRRPAAPISTSSTSSQPPVSQQTGSNNRIKPSKNNKLQTFESQGVDQNKQKVFVKFSSEFEQQHHVGLGQDRVYTIFNIDESRVVKDNGNIQKVDPHPTPYSLKEKIQQFNLNTQQAEENYSIKKNTPNIVIPKPQLLPKPNFQPQQTPLKPFTSDTKERQTQTKRNQDPKPELEPQLKEQMQDKRQQTIKIQDKIEKSVEIDQRKPGVRRDEPGQPGIMFGIGFDNKFLFFAFFMISAGLIVLGYTPEIPTERKAYNVSRDEQESNLN